MFKYLKYSMALSVSLVLCDVSSFVKAQNIDAIKEHLADVANNDANAKSRGKTVYSRLVAKEISTIVDEVFKNKVDNAFIVELLNNIDGMNEQDVFNRAVENNQFRLIEDLINRKMVDSKKAEAMISSLMYYGYFENHLENTRGFVSLIAKQTKGDFSAHVGFKYEHLTAFKVLLEHVNKDSEIYNFVEEAVRIITNSHEDKDSKVFASGVVNYIIDNKKIPYNHVYDGKWYSLISYLGGENQLDFVKRIVEVNELSAADLDKLDDYGWTLLMDVSNYGLDSTDVIRYLIDDLGVNKHIKNNEGKTAYDIVKKTHPTRNDILKLLK